MTNNLQNLNSNPIISVVLPVFNCALYIDDAVNSILNQTFSNFELIIIDDASNDGTVEILKKFNDSRIKFIFKEKNQGVSSATNDGFRVAKGKYIARMDGDDISVKERFEKQIAILESNQKITICSSWIQTFGLSNNVIQYKENHNDIITELLIRCSICMGASMFRREEFTGYYYNEDKNSGEDYEFWTKVAWVGEMYVIQESLLLYRVHSKQASRAHKQQQIIDDVSIQLDLFKKMNYNQHKYSDAFITKMLLLNQPIEIKEFTLFIKWLRELIWLNSKNKVYPQREFLKVLQRIKRTLVINIYFNNIPILGINRLWRIKALFKLPEQEVIYVLKTKANEVRKRIFKLRVKKIS